MNAFCATFMPNFGRLSFPRKLVFGSPAMKYGVILCENPLDLIGISTFRWLVFKTAIYAFSSLVY